MANTYSNCEPSICNRKDLMTNGGEFVNTEMVKNKCKCELRIICFELLKLLKDSNRPEAEALLAKYNKKK